MIPFALAAILAAAPARGSADGGVKVAPVSPKYPLLIDADHAHIEGKKQEAQWRGHVKVTRGPTNIFCNRLVAYYTTADAATAGPDAEALRGYLTESLPEYMAPAAYVKLDALPLTPNGKLDRRALPRPEEGAYAAREYEEPVGEIEARLARIWADVLKLDRVGRRDNFFELVGHSLLGLTLIERMRREGLYVDVDALFTTPTLAALAEAISGASGVVDVPPNLIPPGCEEIRPEMLPRVFELFVQGERNLDRPTGGLGVGLTLVRRLVELHGGRAEAASAGEGKGSVFTVSFLALADMPSAPSPPDEAPARTTRKRILVVEDNADNREMMRILLESSGHEVHEADDGVSGVELAVQLEPDVVLIDIGLPGIDGYQVARQIRSKLRGRSRLIALSGYGQQRDKLRAFEAGYDEHLLKPVDPSRLLSVLDAPRGTSLR